MNEDLQRLRCFSISEQMIINILNGWITIKNFDVPKDARVVGIHNDWGRRGLGIIIESEIFDPVELGANIPWVPMFLVEDKR